MNALHSYGGRQALSADEALAGQLRARSLAGLPGAMDDHLKLTRIGGEVSPRLRPLAACLSLPCIVVMPGSRLPVCPLQTVVPPGSTVAATLV
jgi:hypothetical protein